MSNFSMLAGFDTNVSPCLLKNASDSSKIKLSSPPDSLILGMNIYPSPTLNYIESFGIYFLSFRAPIKS